MKQILLKKLTLSNWRGQSKEVVFSKNNTTIKGENGIGKTSFMSAWVWLLSGYTDVQCPKNSNLFDNTQILSKDTPPAIVTAEVEIDGISWVVSKTAKASFKRDKASGEWVKSTSDTYTYTIDNIERSATEFNAWLEANICPIDMLTYCLMGSFFSALSIDDKKSARKVLEKISGEIKSTDYKGDYGILNEMLVKGYSIDEIMESKKKEKRAIEDRLGKIPEFINMKEALLVALEMIDAKEIEAKKKKVKDEIEEIDKALASSRQQEQAIREERSKILSEIEHNRRLQREGREVHLDKQNSIVSEIKRQISQIESENKVKQEVNRQKLTEHDQLSLKFAAEKNYLKSLEKEIECLRIERDEEKSRVFDAYTCASCGQLLPDADVEELKRSFNSAKREKLDAIIGKGKKLKDVIEAQTKRIEEMGEVLGKCVIYEEIVDCTELKERLQNAIDSAVKYEDTDKYKMYENTISELNNSLPSYEDNIDDNRNVVRKQDLMQELEELNRELGKKDLIKEIKIEIQELQEEQTSLGIQAAKIEGMIEKCKEHNEETAKIVSDRVNDKLSLCEIQMWERQKNGDLAPSCTIQSKHGIKLVTMNHANRLLMEAELQKMFCQAHDIKMPIFYDEASVYDRKHKPVETEWQSVMMMASDDDYLVVE